MLPLAALGEEKRRRTPLRGCSRQWRNLISRLCVTCSLAEGIFETRVRSSGITIERHSERANPHFGHVSTLRITPQIVNSQTAITIPMNVWTLQAHTR